MEEEAMTSEGNTSLVHDGKHMSLHTNGQVSSEQPDTLEQQQNIAEVTITNKLKDDSPTVVVKKTVSLHMQSTIVNGVPLESTEFVKDTVAAEIENVPILLPRKEPENTAVPADDKGLIQESELVAVEKTPAFVQMEPTFDSGVAKGNEEEEISREISVSEPRAEDVPDSHECEHLLNSNGLGNHREDEKALDQRGTIEESSPIVIEKRPASLHMERVLLEEGSTEVQEPIEEASVIAVESEPRVTEVDRNDEGNSVEVEYEPAAATHKNEEETVSEAKETIAEKPPLVVEKRPFPLHMEVEFDHKEDEAVRKPIEEAPHDFIEKRPVSLHIEQMFNGEGSVEVQEPIEEASAVAVESEPRVCGYHPMLEETEEDENVDGNSVEVEYEPAVMTPRSEEEMGTETSEMITETSPLVVEKRPVSLHVEAAFDHKEGEQDRKPIEEAPHEVVEKRPVSLHMEQMFNEEGTEEVQEPIEEASAVAVESEPRACDYHAMLEETVADKNVHGNSVEVEYEPSAMTSGKKDVMATETNETITEESPLVVEKRPVSLHVEAAFDHKEGEQDRKPIEEAPHEIVEKRPVSLHMEQMFNEEGTEEVQEPIEEASAVAVESEPRACDYHPLLEETVADKNVDGNSVEVEYESSAMTSGKKDVMATETNETITEESPLVVEKRPESLHIKAAFDHKEDEEGRKPIEEVPHEVIEKRPVSLHMEQVFNEQGTNEVQEPVEEASAVAVESEPRVCDYHPMLEETVADKNVDGNSVEVEYEPSAMTSGKKDVMATETSETITEESPLVVEKRPASLHIEVAFDHKEDEKVRKPIQEVPHEVIEKRPVSLHMEQVFNEEGTDEVQEPIEEASAVAEHRVFDYHPMLEERTDEKIVYGNSVEVEYEPLALTADTKEETNTEIEPRESVAEESPLVVEKRPLSLHIEAAFDPKEDVKEPIEEEPPQIIEKRPVSLHMENILDESVASEVQEPIEEVSVVAVRSELRVREYHPMLKETVEDENVVGNCVEVEYEPAVTTLKNEEKTVSETEKMIAEESPLVEKRPVSLHLEAVFDHKEEGKVKDPIKEAPLEVIEKRPASLHMEQMFNEKGNNEVQEPIEEASALAVESKPRVCDYHPMLEETVENENIVDNSAEVEYEPAATTHKNEKATETEAKDAITEESPFVVERRPVSLHLEAVFEHKEEGEVKEPIKEAPLEIIEKRPVSFHVEQMFIEEGNNEVQEPIEEAAAVSVESKVCDYHPMLEETEEDENFGGNSVEVEYEPAAMKLDFEGETETETKDAIMEDSPLVVEKRPASLHMEAVFKPKEEVKEPIEEAPREIIEKRPVSLHMEHIFNEEGSPEIQKPTEEASAVVVETEHTLFRYHPMLKEKAEDKNVYTKSVEVEYEPAAANREEETKTDTRETIAEESPPVVETRPASLHLEVVVDYVKGPVVVKPVEETPPIVVDKTPTDNSQDNESVAKEEPSGSVHVLDTPKVQKVKEVEDSVQEAVAPVVERKAPEFHHELLQTVETGDEKPEDTTLEVRVEETEQVGETEILDDEVQVPELKSNEAQESRRNEVISKTEVISTVTINQRTGDENSHEMETNVVQTTYEKKTMEYSNTSTTEETFTSTSFTKLNQHGRDDDDELLRHVLRKRLSAPEVLPEKENDGSAPLAASEDRGILESQEQFGFADNSRKKDSTPIHKPQVSGATPSETEPYEDLADEEKLIADPPGEAEVAVDDTVENEERAGESLPVLLLLAPEEEKGDYENEQKKGRASGPSQCKCCSLM